MATLEEFAKLSQFVYTLDRDDLPTDWAVMEKPDGNPVLSFGRNGYFGAVLVKEGTGERALVSRGLELGDVGDRRSGLALLAGQVPAQMGDVRFFLDWVRRDLGISELTLVGHSLGGSLSQLLGAEEGLPAVTFNAVPVGRILPAIGRDPSASYPITDVVDPADPLPHVGPHVGYRIVLPRTGFPWPQPGVPMNDPSDAGASLSAIYFGIANSHGIASVVAKLQAAATLPCPLALDLDGDGVETTSVAQGPRFDHDGDGFAERTGWIAPDDGLLVRDCDGDGAIESGRELFGNYTLLAAGGTAGNGYAALAELDTDGDGRVGASDTAFAQLRVWRDTDGDGVSQADELHALASLGIESIGVGHAEGSHVDAQGNAHRQVGIFTRGDGGTGATADVWFQADRVRSLAVDWLPVPASIASLPDAVGFGQVRDLHQAAVRDGVLEGLVRAFVDQDDRGGRAALLDQIVFRWTGVDGLDPASRGGLIDARKVGAIERFAAEPFGSRPGVNPAGPASLALDIAYRDLAEMVYSQLMATTHLADLYALVAYAWDEPAQSLRADLTSVIAELDRRLAADPASGTAQLGEFARTLRGWNADAIYDFQPLRDHFVGRGGDVTWAVESAGRRTIEGGPGPDLLAGPGGPVAIRGGAGDDGISGDTGDDILWGDEGSDVLAGGSGNDVLDGGGGDDVLEAGFGDDTYAFGRGGGRDTVNDRDWQIPNRDRVLVAPDVSPAQLTVRRVENDLVLGIAGTSDQLRIGGWFLEGFGADYQVQEVHFADGTVWDIEALKRRALEPTEGPDVLVGTSAAERIEGLGGDDRLSGGAGADVVDGGAGADYLDGGSGDDVLRGGPDGDDLRGGDGDDLLDGGAGHDALEGGFGNDTYVFGPGSGRDTVSDRDWQVPNTDRVLVAAGVAPSQVAVRRIDNDLVLGIAGTADEIWVGGWFLEGFGADYQVQRVEFADGTVWDIDALKQRALAASEGPDVLIGTSSPDTINGLGGDDEIRGAHGTDVLDGGSGADLLDGGPGDDVLRGGPGADDLRGGDGDDLLDGGPASDVLEGGFGNDTYVLGRGTGQDTVNDRDWQVPSIDRVLVAAGVTPAEVRVQRVDNDLVVAIAATADELRISGWFLEGFGADYQVQRVEFADGTVWDIPTLRQLTAAIEGTGGADTLIGTAAGEILRGLAGADVLWGRDGADVLDGGPGADRLAGEGGDDTYVVDDPGDVVTEGAGQGIDTVQASIGYTLGANVERLTLTGGAAIGGTGNALDNVLAGNGANNVLTGGKGNDRYLFGRGAGQDTIVENDGTAGNTDVVVLGDGLRPLDLVIGRIDRDLRMSVHGTADVLFVKDWHRGPANRVEVFQAPDGRRLLASRVALLVQDMASYSAKTGLTWDQAIDQRPDEVQGILAAHWQSA